MTVDYLKEKKELVSVVLLCFSAVLAVSILVKVTGFFMASARAERIVTDAVAQNTEAADGIDKYFTKYKMLADALKKNNLFAPPVAKQPAQSASQPAPDACVHVRQRERDAKAGQHQDRVPVERDAQP